MNLHDIANFAHSLTHSHGLLSKKGTGEFSLCTPRLPWAGTRVMFRPDFDDAGWFYVPAVTDEDGELLFSRVAGAGSAWAAMAVLRAEYAQGAGKAAGRA